MDVEQVRAAVKKEITRTKLLPGFRYKGEDWEDGYVEDMVYLYGLLKQMRDEDSRYPLDTVRQSIVSV